jgi:ribonuclease HII
MMQDLDVLFPGYAFGAHKGYATPQHRERLKDRGPCVHHRRTFVTVREAM